MTDEKATKETIALGRREMLLKAGAGAGFVTLWLTGCGDSGGGGGGTKDDASVKDDAKVGDDGQVLADGQAPDGNVPDGNVPDGNLPDAHVADLACINDPSFSGHAGHAIVIPMGDLTTVQERTYDIQGASGHTHSVTISIAKFNELIAGGTTVTVTSTGGGMGNHTHTLTWTC